MIKRLQKKIQNIFLEEFKFLEVIILMAMTAVIGVVLGGFIIKKNYGIISESSQSEPLKEFVDNYNYILDNYYGTLNEKELLETRCGIYRLLFR
jgi:hypothetical protein